MRVSEVARKYAKALFDETANTKEQQDFLKQLRVIAEAFSEKTITEFFTSPLVPVEIKTQFVQKVVTGKISKAVENVLILMAKNGRIPVLSEFVLAYENLTDAAHGVTRGVVKSARPLSEASQNQLEQIVDKVVGKKVIFTFEEDRDLVGGLKAQVGGWTFDDSISSHFTRMHEDLNRRTN